MSSTSRFGRLLEAHTPDYTPYEAFYKKLHANPELSGREHETAASVARTLRALSSDLEIKEGIGGTGLVAILRNGPGKTMLLRADMDALPLKELTGLEYASTKEMEDIHGVLRPVMHACGHDMHVTALLATAETLISSRAEWSGTVVFLFQPSEEGASGAHDMVKDGLYEKYCPVPDILFAQHVGFARAGVVATKPGALLAGTDSLTVRVFGRGGHGSMPHSAVDPILLASRIVVHLQSIVSREVPPGELAVVTVGSFHAGTAPNIISEEAVLQVNTRFVHPERGPALLDAIKRIVRAECEAARSPREPIFEPIDNAPATLNDAATTQLVLGAFTDHFGADQTVVLTDVFPASEDFSNLATPIKKPYCFWNFGGHDPADWDRREKAGELDSIPTNHSPQFAPVVQPTLRVGTEAFVVATLTALAQKSD